MRLLPRTAWLWIAGSSATAMALWTWSWWRDTDRAAGWIALGVSVSLVAWLASKATVAIAGATRKPLHRMLIETSVRMAVPLGVLLAVIVARRDLLSTEFLLYFLPFQFITIVTGTLAALDDVGRHN